MHRTRDPLAAHTLCLRHRLRMFNDFETIDSHCRAHKRVIYYQLYLLCESIDLLHPHPSLLARFVLIKKIDAVGRGLRATGAHRGIGAGD